VDEITYKALPLKLRKLYGKEETVEGRRKNHIQARRCIMIPDDQVSTTDQTIESICDLFDQLSSKELLLNLMLRMKMKVESHPSKLPGVFQLQSYILDWAAVQKGGLKRLEKALGTVIAKQSKSQLSNVEV
jgi:hypothetical protein